MDVIVVPTHFRLFNLKLAAGCRSALLGKGSLVLLKDSRNLSTLLHNLASILRTQHEHELSATPAPIKVSPFLQTLVKLVVEMRLDPVFMAQPNLAFELDADDLLVAANISWKWILDAVQAIRALRALATR